MNETIELLLTHKSDRSYLDKDIPETVLDHVINAAWRAPTSVHSQQVSVIVTRDKATKAKIAELSGGQPWIARAPVFLTFVLDLYKTRKGLEAIGDHQLAHTSIEGIIAGSQDVGIALASSMLAARAQGLGVVPIGGIRKNPQQIIELLELPEMTFPINGLTLGYVDTPAYLKPRMPIDSFRHEEKYHRDNLMFNIDSHNQALIAHWETIGRNDGDIWSKTVADYYNRIYYPDILPSLLKQQFQLNK